MTEPTTLAQLRHLYQNMVNGAVSDAASAKRIAEGLLAPAIEALERGIPPAVDGEPIGYLYCGGSYWNQNEDNHWRVTATPRAWVHLPPTTSAGSGNGE